MSVVTQRESPDLGSSLAFWEVQLGSFVTGDTGDTTCTTQVLLLPRAFLMATALGHTYISSI